jgi:hypothetical protein
MAASKIIKAISKGREKVMAQAKAEETEADTQCKFIFKNSS